MTAPFDRPDAGGGDLFSNAEHVGALLVIQPKEAVRGMETVNGPADAIVADVFVIGPPGIIAEEFHDTYLFGKVLQGQLKRKIGRTVLGVLNGEPGVKRGGQNVPYTLGDPSPAQEQAAIRAMSSRPDPVAQQAPAPQRDPWGEPVQPQRQPAADPWGQAPAAPAPQQPAPGGWGQQPLPSAPAPQPAASDPWGAAPAAPWEQPAGAPPF